MSEAGKLSRVVITIEDLPDGRCAIAADPTWQTLRDKHASGHGLTAAEGYAFRAFRAVHEESRKEEKKLINKTMDYLRKL